MIKSSNFDREFKNYIFVGLDENSMIIDQKLLEELGKSIPNFNNFRPKLREIYNQLNSELSNMFPKAKKSPKKGYTVPNRKSTSLEFKNLIYNPTEKEDLICKKIIETIYNVIDQNIIKKIPKLNSKVIFL